MNLRAKAGVVRRQRVAPALDADPSSMAASPSGTEEAAMHQVGGDERDTDESEGDVCARRES